MCGEPWLCDIRDGHIGCPWHTAPLHVLKKTEFGVGSVHGIETNAKRNVSFLNSCKVHHCTTSDVVINISNRVSLLQPQYTQSSKFMLVHVPLAVAHETVRRPYVRTMASILSPQTMARLGCVLLRRTRLFDNLYFPLLPNRFISKLCDNNKSQNYSNVQRKCNLKKVGLQIAIKNASVRNLTKLTK